jgi:transcriptional regulator with XRE-family HTH domain
MPGTSPTARQRELGIKLRALRNEHGMTVEDVAEQLLCSATKISRLETATRRPSLRDVRDLCTLYEVDKVTSAELMNLAREAREPGWWTEYEDLDLDPLVGLEQVATDIICYSMSYIPGLLQTVEYAQGIIQTVAPKMDPQIVHQRAEARLRRQKLLEADNPPRFHVLMDEVVLHRGVGGPAVMTRQLQKVFKAARNSKVVVQVIPFSAGAYAAMDGYFVLLEFSNDSELWPVVFVEGLSENQYLERRDEIARYRETIDYLRARALDPRDSLTLIANARDAYRTQ